MALFQQETFLESFSWALIIFVLHTDADITQAFESYRSALDAVKNYEMAPA